MTGSQIGRPIEVLLVEDNPGDVRLTQEALKEGRLRNNLTVAENGEKGLAILGRQDPFASSPRPDLVLLDLNLPGRSGREVLAEIKDDPDLKRIPVVVLTTSRAEEDVYRSYDVGASSFITKPVTFEGLVDVMKTLKTYWFEIVELPSNGHESGLGPG